MALSGLRVFGVARLLSGRKPLAADTSVMRFRDIAAVARRAAFAPEEPNESVLREYRRVLEEVFERTPILPAPVGTTFRSAEQLQQWLEENYIALVEGLHFVDGRCETRVHVSGDGETLAGDAEDDAAAAAAECFRVLRRHATAAVPLKRTPEPHGTLSGAYLIERDGWNDFTEQVRELARRHQGLVFEQTGPWPPYDFVRMDFGA